MNMYVHERKQRENSSTAAELSCSFQLCSQSAWERHWQGRVKGLAMWGMATSLGTLDLPCQLQREQQSLALRVSFHLWHLRGVKFLFKDQPLNIAGGFLIKCLPHLHLCSVPRTPRQLFQARVNSMVQAIAMISLGSVLQCLREMLLKYTYVYICMYVSVND